jgi:hypothetical protein
MDYIKDGQKADSLARFVDNQEIKTSPFGDNRIGERAYRRAERIVAALHLLTNHVASEEPAREIIRRKGLELLSEVLELRDKMRASASADFTTVQASIRNLISLLRMLTVGGSISIQNGEIVIDALDELGNFLITSVRSSFTESVRLSREDLLDVREPALRFIKDKDIKDNQTKDRSVANGQASDSASHNSLRAERIVAVLRQGGEFGIRDIVSHLPEYSEKMIQRELAQLVSGGKAKKSGLKRWSKYAISDAERAK